MGRNIGAVAQQSTISTLPIIGGVSPVFRSGANYKAVGEVVQRSQFPALATAFQPNGSFATETIVMPKQKHWRGMAYGNGVFVAVGGYDATTDNIGAVSADGRTWTQTIVTNPANRQWYTVCFGSGLFVAGADSGQIATSPDGIAWTQRTSNVTHGIRAIAYSGSMFVAVCEGNVTEATTSPDGITWTARTMPTSTIWAMVTYGGGKFLAISESTSAAATSPDGITWTARTMPGASWASVTYFNGLFVAVSGVAAGGYATSPDGVTWTSRTFPDASAQPMRLVSGNGVLIALGSGKAFTSTDGINWVPRATAMGSSSDKKNTAVAYGPGYFAAVAGDNVTNGALLFAENSTDSDYLYLSGTPGDFVRVK
jgi:hypothetical protein